MTYDDPQYELIAYVEGALSPEQASQFEAKLAASESLREQLMLLKQADERLRYGFAAPGFVKIDFAAARRAAGVGDGAPTEPRRANWRWARVAAAALAAVITVVAVLQWVPRGAARVVATAEGLYDAQVRSGFVPDHVCTTDEDFIEYSRNMLGVPLLAQNDASIQIVGWVYANRTIYRDLGVSERTRIILAKVDGTEVVLLLDPADSTGPTLDPAAARRLRLFESNVAGVDLFEITPLDAPLVSRKFKAM